MLLWVLKPRFFHLKRFYEVKRRFERLPHLPGKKVHCRQKWNGRLIVAEVDTVVEIHRRIIEAHGRTSSKKKVLLQNVNMIF